ncbi:branched-chain amino acid ABC transporter permease [Geodermatophilus sp. DF01-2]|uniref:branched-chain amino acid ABC transporter permease n=1 Tax=Geodermatophilus sp. DF01-2 TaxID=2559610 RepID=UPI0010733067|nr:branched-chain amino acid ABC transporter permease [Geodermatophilus sp. DF01_2]TFV59839.1 branched-chain amino acid ABC transporter permease [Geodermatophilus sp. DF01_2]
MSTLPFWATVLTFGLVIGMAALLLNIEAGWGGMWDLGIAGQVAVGAYSYALLTSPPDAVVPGLGLPFWAAMVGAGLITMIVSALIGWPTLRLRGEYFLITTFAFAEIIRQLIVIQRGLTGGTFGVTGIDKPFAEYFLPSAYPFILLGLAAAATVLVLLVSQRVSNSTYGLTLRAARDNEPLARSMGTAVDRVRIATYALVGLMTGLLVAPVYVWFLGALVPASFTTHLTFLVWTGLVIGGLGSRLGGLIGAVVLTVASEAVRLISVDPEHASRLAAFQPFLVGVLLIVLLRWRPEGLLSERGAFRKRAKPLDRIRRDDPQTLEAVSA